VHGGSAILSTSAGFQAVTMSLRESGLRRIISTILAIWSMDLPSCAGQDRHCWP